VQAVNQPARRSGPTKTEHHRDYERSTTCAFGIVPPVRRAKFSAIKDEHEGRFNIGNYFFKVFAKRLIRIGGVGIIGIVRIVRIVRMVRIVRTGIGEPDSEGESESDENRIGPKETVIREKATVMEKAAINEKAIIGEKVAVKIVESTVEESATSSKAWTLKLVEAANVKTHTASLKTSRTTVLFRSYTKERPKRDVKSHNYKNIRCFSGINPRG